MTAEVLARLLVTKEALISAKAALAAARWDLLYRDKLEILERDILPRFPEAMHADATMRARVLPPVPPVE